MQFFNRYPLFVAAVLLGLQMGGVSGYPSEKATGETQLETAANSTKKADFNYVFTVFTWGGESNMYVYTSDDGINFDLVKGPAYVCLHEPRALASHKLTRPRSQQTP
jgi:hypothetical protein